MKWLITGGCGFIGSNVIRHLLVGGHKDIRVIDNLSIGTAAALETMEKVTKLNPADVKLMTEGCGIELVVGDIMDAALAKNVAAGADVIIHLAANAGVQQSVENPIRDCQTNVLGTLNYLEAARLAKVPRFVFASSGAPLGKCEPPVHEEKPAHPISPYGASKLAGEGYCQAYAACYGIKSVILRFGNVYGPGSGHKTSVVAKFLSESKAGRQLVIYGDGSATRDFIYIDDLVDAVLRSAQSPETAGEIFQIATSRETTIEELAEALSDVLEGMGKPRPKIYHDSPRVGDMPRNFSDTRKALKVLGWKSTTSLPQGLVSTAQYFFKDRTG